MFDLPSSFIVTISFNSMVFASKHATHITSMQIGLLFQIGQKIVTLLFDHGTMSNKTNDDNDPKRSTIQLGTNLSRHPKNGSIESHCGTYRSKTINSHLGNGMNIESCHCFVAVTSRTCTWPAGMMVSFFSAIFIWQSSSSSIEHLFPNMM